MQSGVIGVLLPERGIIPLLIIKAILTVSFKQDSNLMLLEPVCGHGISCRVGGLELKLVGNAHMLAPHLNLEFGLGLWAGADIYKVYSCPSCGLTLDGGVKGFVLPDDITIALVYVF